MNKELAKLTNKNIKSSDSFSKETSKLLVRRKFIDQKPTELQKSLSHIFTSWIMNNYNPNDKSI